LNEQRDIALVFSGECFLESQTGIELRQKGHQIGPHKANWLVHLYEENGEQFFEKLNGLFSGLLIDKRRRKAFLFNDRYGVERIYWHESEDGFYFASEAKALLHALPELRAFDKEGVAQFLTFGCTLEQRTLFRGINTLPGASLWSFENGDYRKGKYFSPEIWERQPTLSPGAFEANFQETFKRILRRYFESESRIGISLTAGLDTRMIMACLPQTAEKPVCYTFAGVTGETLDVRLAVRVAKACHLEHRILRIGPDFFSNFASHADQTVYVTDGCFGISGAHEIYMNRQARQLSPIRLTGNYGSEILRGVSNLKPLRLSPRLVNPEFHGPINASIQQMSEGSRHPVTFAALQDIPWNLFGNLAAGRSQVGFRSPYLDNEIVALACQSPENVRKSQLPGLRFVKNNNQVLCKIPTDKGYVGGASGLAEMARRCFSKVTFKLDYLNNEGLPHWFSPFDPWLRLFTSRAKILGLHKHLHYRSWFRRELAEYINGILTDAKTSRSRFWNSDFLKSVAKDHIRGRNNYACEINAVLTLEAVERLLFRDPPYGVSDLRDSGTEGSRKESLLAT
jgi:asparagine synthase (glutamine-hydrolysing)